MLLNRKPALSERPLGLQPTGPYPHQGVCDAWWQDVGQALRQTDNAISFQGSPTTSASPVPRLRSASNHSAQQHGGPNAMDRILQEISAVGSRLEGMDNTMASLTAETKSMRLDIAGFQSRVTGLEQRVTTVETHITSSQDRDQELIYLCSKLIDLKARSRRDNVCLF
ncbi:hypothetical protein NDU88_002091 [Pleurodeles waltl]|uniref:Uncharacterized protein n=1 Tax=Pleurodeles waltl TaxID=8319 RepID=A0AAV7NCN1_PLEWA|nr:hypothetical protein NDU88_002091 [Pleurodeles waltl]